MNNQRLSIQILLRRQNVLKKISLSLVLAENPTALHSVKSAVDTPSSFADPKGNGTEKTGSLYVYVINWPLTVDLIGREISS